MSKTVSIPVSPIGRCEPAMPVRCVNCGAPKEAESLLTLHRLVMRGRSQKQILIKLAVPHCGACARATKNVFLAGFIPFVGGVVVVGVAVFVVVAFGAAALGLDDYGAPHNNNSLVLGAAAGLFAGLVGGFLFEVASRVVLYPVFGRALMRAPLLAVQFLRDADYVAGLSGRLTPDASSLELEFSNEEVAREFKSLNGL